jgi:hypothetical protein
MAKNTKNKTVRSAGQKLISIPVSDDFMYAVDEGLPKVGFASRSEMIRMAIIKLYEANGIKIDPSLAMPPSRVGKGGRPPKK